MQVKHTHWSTQILNKDIETICYSHDIICEVGLDNTQTVRAIKTTPPLYFLDKHQPAS